MLKCLLWVITLCLLIINLGCNKLWPLPLPDNTASPQSQTQPLNEPYATKAPQGLISLPLPLSPFFKATPADITQIERNTVDLINEDRRKAGLDLVIWDETAAEAARQHVLEEAESD